MRSPSPATTICLILPAVILAFSCSETTRPDIAVATTETALPGVDTGREHLSFRSIAELILPAVVEIRVTEETAVGRIFDFPPLEGTGLGSGVLVAKDGNRYFAATNRHVVGESPEIVVVTEDGTEFPGHLKGADSRLDIAVVSFESSHKELSLASFGDSDLLEVGDWVLAAGNPFGLASSLTAGIVSAKGRMGPAGNISDFIQTDASINQGNSGGPLVNTRGEIVGINTWITTDTGVNVGLGFAMPINNVRKAIGDIISEGTVHYGWLGVEIGDVRQDEAEALSFNEQNGVIVHGVFNDSPAELGGICPGDIVVAINGESITDYRHLSRIVGSIAAGEEAVFGVYRTGKEMSFAMTIGLRGSEAEIEKAYNEMWPGFSIMHTDVITDDYYEYAVRGLMIIDLPPLGIPKTAGLEKGDVIVSINTREVKNLVDFYQVMNDTEIDAFDFLLNRSGEEITIGIIRR